MVSLTGSNITYVPESVSRNVGRLTLRLLLALSLVAAITFVFFRLIHVNATTVGFFYLVAILVIATVVGAPGSNRVLRCCDAVLQFLFLPAHWDIHHRRSAELGGAVCFFGYGPYCQSAFGSIETAKREALDRQREMERLYALSRAILLTDTTQPTAKQIAHQIAQAFECPAVALYDRNSR